MGPSLITVIFENVQIFLYKFRYQHVRETGLLWQDITVSHLPAAALVLLNAQAPN